jgi:hypothetical protein
VTGLPVAATAAKRLGIYLNDHLAGATAGRDLARRAAQANRENPDFGPALSELAAEIDEDRDALISLMARLQVSEDRVKQLGGWGAEKLGRLKLNGQLVGYSPLSRLVELDGLVVGVTGKLALWRALESVAKSDPRLEQADLARLIERAERQLARVEERRLAAAALALTC